MSDTFKIGIKARLKHGVLLEALTRKGWNQTQAAEYLQVPMQTFGKWINLQEVPKKLSEEQIKRLLELTGMLPDQLWPDYVRSQDFLDAPKTFEVVKDVDAPKLIEAMRTLRQLPAGEPDKLFEQKELAEKIDELLGTLRPREALVIRSNFFEGRTDDETGKMLNVSATRVRHLEYKALRKLRHPSNSGQLRPYLKDE